MDRWVKFYFGWIVILFGCICGWLYFHTQPCLILYGVGSPHDSTDLFLACEDSNMAATFGAQFVAVICIPIVALLALICDRIFDFFMRFPKNSLDKV
jgi:hypothetical protein